MVLERHAIQQGIEAYLIFNYISDDFVEAFIDYFSIVMRLIVKLAWHEVLQQLCTTIKIATGPFLSSVYHSSDISTES